MLGLWKGGVGREGNWMEGSGNERDGRKHVQGGEYLGRNAEMEVKRQIRSPKENIRFYSRYVTKRLTFLIEIPFYDNVVT